MWQPSIHTHFTTCIKHHQSYHFAMDGQSVRASVGHSGAVHGRFSGFDSGYVGALLVNMRGVIQRVVSASVKVDGEIVASIGKGILCLVGISKDDVASNDGEWLARKITVRFPIMVP